MTTSSVPARALTALPGPDRSVPEQLIDIAVLAIRRGAQRVSLLHEGLGADFPAPIGWLLRIRRLEDPEHPKHGHTDFLNHQVGCDLGDLVAPAWLAEASDAVVIDELVELFEIGIRNGWSVSYEREMFEHAILQQSIGKRGVTLTFGMRHKLEADASNWFYSFRPFAPANVVSTNAYLSIREGESRDVIAFADDGGSHRQVSQVHIDALIRQQAPNSAPVAYYDEEQEGWTR